VSFIASQLKSTKGVGTDRLKAIVYGPAGVGKTYLASTTPDPEGTLILSAEAGLLTLSTFDIRFVEITDLSQLNSVMEELVSGTFPCTWLIIDSLSEICEVCLAHEMEAARDPRKAYGELAKRMITFVRLCRDLPMHVIMTAKMDRDTSGTDAFMTVGLPGKMLIKDVPHFFDFMLPLRTFQDDEGTIRRALQTQPADGYVAKSRVPFKEVFIPATLSYLQQAILQEDNS
jgi:hypothetical protein